MEVSGGRGGDRGRKGRIEEGKESRGKGEERVGEGKRKRERREEGKEERNR